MRVGRRNEEGEERFSGKVEERRRMVRRGGGRGECEIWRR